MVLTTEFSELYADVKAASTQAVAGSESVVVSPTASGPFSMISLMAVILFAISVAAEAEPAVSRYCAITVCEGDPISVFCATACIREESMV